MTQNGNIVVSVIAPLYNDADILEAFAEQTQSVLDRTYEHYELVLVDDCSIDNTQAAVDRLLSRRPRIRCLQLSRPFGREAAIAAGLESAIGDFVVIIDPRTDPPDRIPDFVEACRTASGIAIGVAEPAERASWIVRAGARVFQWYTRRVLGMDVRPRATHFCALNRQAVNAILQIKDQTRYLRLLTTTVGFGQTPIEYKQKPEAGSKTVRALMEEINLGMEMLISLSRHPLRFLSRLGLFLSFMNALYVLYVFVVNIVKRTTEGWTTLSLQNAVMFFFLFLTLAVVCEYIGRILEETRTRPVYFILNEKNSSVVMEDLVEKNIVNRSHEP